MLLEAGKFILAFITLVGWEIVIIVCAKVYFFEILHALANILPVD
jgi:hypothetical protein